MNKKLYFEKIEGIGNLYLEKVFLYYDEPILFSCTDENEHLYFVNCTEMRDEYRWLIFLIDANCMIDLLSKEITIREAFDKSRQKLLIVEDCNNDTCNVREVSSKDIYDIPTEGIFLDVDQELRDPYIGKLANQLRSEEECGASSESYFDNSIQFGDESEIWIDLFLEEEENDKMSEEYNTNDLIISFSDVGNSGDQCSENLDMRLFKDAA